MATITRRVHPGSVGHSWLLTLLLLWGYKPKNTELELTITFTETR